MKRQKGEVEHGRVTHTREEVGRASGRVRRRQSIRPCTRRGRLVPRRSTLRDKSMPWRDACSSHACQSRRKASTMHSRKGNRARPEETFRRAGQNRDGVHRAAPGAGASTSRWYVAAPGLDLLLLHSRPEKSAPRTLECAMPSKVCANAAAQRDLAVLVQESFTVGSTHTRRWRAGELDSQCLGALTTRRGTHADLQTSAMH